VPSPHSNLKEGIAAILKAEGYISDYNDGVTSRATRRSS
jgi:ribosomal protein S8